MLVLLIATHLAIRLNGFLLWFYTPLGAVFSLCPKTTVQVESGGLPWEQPDSTTVRAMYQWAFRPYPGAGGTLHNN